MPDRPERLLNWVHRLQNRSLVDPHFSYPFRNELPKSWLRNSQIFENRNSGHLLIDLVSVT